MSEDNKDKLSTWKNWLIKKLLKDDSSKEEILNFIASEEESNDENDDADANLDEKQSLVNNYFDFSYQSAIAYIMFYR